MGYRKIEFTPVRHREVPTLFYNFSVQHAHK